jgi:RHS repeat-associated protein
MFLCKVSMYKIFFVWVWFERFVKAGRDGVAVWVDSDRHDDEAEAHRTLAVLTSLYLRTPLKVDVIRDRGALARMVEMGRIENVYDVQHRRILKRVFASNGSGGWTLAKSVAFTYDDWNVIEEREYNANGELTHHLRHTWGADFSGSLQGVGGVGGLVLSEEPTRWMEGRQTAAGRPAGVRTRVESPNQLDTTGNSNPPVRHYFWYDGNGNVTGIVDGAGSVEATYRYTSFGAMVESSTSTSFAQRNSMKFSAKYYDPEVEPIAGTYYYGYRHFLPSTGRWPSRDPIGEEGGANLYGMAYNDILNSVEFLGLHTCSNPRVKDPECLRRAKADFDIGKIDARADYDIAISNAYEMNQGRLDAAALTYVAALG